MNDFLLVVLPDGKTEMSLHKKLVAVKKTSS